MMACRILQEESEYPARRSLMKFLLAQFTGNWIIQGIG